MKKHTTTLLILLSPLLFITSCGKSNGTDSKSSSEDESSSTTPVYGKMVDSRDNHEYKTVVINGNTWMAENLTVTHFRNGDEIPQVQSDSKWYELRTPAWCYYNNDPKNEALYGKLYNWYALNDKRGLAPEGWHVATKVEWWEKIGKVNDIGYKMKDPKDWDNSRNPHSDPIGNNITGFTALPGGLRTQRGEFFYQGSEGRWWSSNDKPYGLILKTQFKNLDFVSCDSRTGLSVRCVKGSDGFVTVPKTVENAELEVSENGNCSSCVEQVVTQFVEAALSLDANEMKKYITECNTFGENCEQVELLAREYHFKEFYLPQYIKGNQISSMKKLKSDKHYIQFYSSTFAVAVVPAKLSGNSLPESVYATYLMLDGDWKVIGIGRPEDKELIEKSVI